ncbi:regulator of telomere elongation helicase 1 homolog [Cyclospora cayetanensis]|uniref:Regulator of telomere elongation helicase 1 homolog n=1 Tax=Cyclospora cayetanensis TaxID=88456 RepID=A0A6P6RY78_9EIME|nr:regulator of telomere elongation helicase 1 homolog [Cyclospora cayetanensis]
MTPWSLAAAAAAALRRQVSKKPDEASEAPATAAAVSPPARRTENGSIAPAEASAQVESLATSVRVALRPSDAKAASGVVSTPVGCQRWEGRLCGVPVSFPFSPYTSQQLLMTKAVEACLKGEHALLESPTGTGKTLCLLTATLAVQQQQHSLQQQQLLLRKVAKPPLSEATEAAWNSPQQPQQLQGPLVGKIVYASRTHGQLQHVIAELRKTSYSVPPTQGSFLQQRQQQAQSQQQQSQVRERKKPSSVVGWGALAPVLPSAGPPAVTSAASSTKEESTPAPHAKVEPVTEAAAGIAATAGGRPGGVRVCVLGSREHLCVNASLKHLKGASLARSCKQKVKAQACAYYSGFIRNRDAISQRLFLEGGLDIEELRSLAITGPELFCPYYQMRDMQSRCEVVMLPYNYLMDLEGQSALLSPETLKQALVIIDEAHNIEGVAENACSFTLRQVDVGRCLTALQQVAALLCDEPEPQGEADPPLPTPAAVYTLGESLQLLDKWLAQLELHPPTPQLSTPHRLLPLDAFAPAVRAVGGPLRSSGSCGARKQQIKPQLDPDGPTAIQGFLGFESREGLRQTLDRCVGVALAV